MNREASEDEGQLMEGVQFRQYTTDDRCYKQALLLRNETLRLPLGLDLFEEDLAAESSQWHYGLWRAERLVASVSIKPIDGRRVKLRQMCVAESERGHGLGRQLVEKVEMVLCGRGICEIELAARATVVPFYQRLGYMSVGEIFVEVTIPHQKMIKQLQIATKSDKSADSLD